MQRGPEGRYNYIQSLDGGSVLLVLTWLNSVNVFLALSQAMNLQYVEPKGIGL